MLNTKVIFAIAATCLIGLPVRSSNVDYCDSTQIDDQIFKCRITPNNSQPAIYDNMKKLDANFSTLPSCKIVDDNLKKLSEVADVLAQKTNGLKRKSLNDMIPNEVSKEESTEAMDSAMVFSTRLFYSPIAKQYYFNYLNKQETANGNFNRPTVTINSKLDRNNTNTIDKQSGSKNTKDQSYYNINNSIAIEYELFDLQNFYTTKALVNSAKASYEEFTNNAINDSLLSVGDYYDLKKSILSAIIAEAQFKATKEQVDRLEKLETKGLQSILDISRANVTEVSQNTNYTNAKSQLAQSHQILLKDLNYKSFNDERSNMSKNLISSACWEKSPIQSLQLALENNANIKKLNYNIESSKFSQKSIRAGLVPEFTVGVSYSPGYKWGNLNGTGNQNDYTNTESIDAYIEMKWNLLDFNQTEVKSKAQANMTSSIKNELKETINQIESTIETAMIEYISSTINIMDLSKGTRKATENYTKAIKAYKQGFLDQTDVTGVFTQLTSMTENLITNIGKRNNAAIQIAATVQQEGFDSINFKEDINKFKKSN